MTNTFHYTVVTSGALARASVETAVEAFYDAIDNYLSALILQTGHEIKHYDLDDPPPRLPVAEHEFDLGQAPNTNRLPGEVACVMSYRAAYISGVNPQSQRNRMYIGPLADTTVASTGLISGVFVPILADAGQAMWNSINASGNAESVIYSPTRDETWPIQTLWVNNEFDTQRRRGTRETAREQRGITGA